LPSQAKSWEVIGSSAMTLEFNGQKGVGGKIFIKIRIFLQQLYSKTKMCYLLRYIKLEINNLSISVIRTTVIGL
jgi:hypothetical protein